MRILTKRGIVNRLQVIGNIDDLRLDSRAHFLWNHPCLCQFVNDVVTRDGGCRVELLQSIVNNGYTPEVFDDDICVWIRSNGTLWIADGWHRTAILKALNKPVPALLVKPLLNKESRRK